MMICYKECTFLFFSKCLQADLHANINNNMQGGMPNLRYLDNKAINKWHLDWLGGKCPRAASTPEAGVSQILDNQPQKQRKDGKSQAMGSLQNKQTEASANDCQYFRKNVPKVSYNQ